MEPSGLRLEVPPDGASLCPAGPGLRGPGAGGENFFILTDKRANGGKKAPPPPPPRPRDQCQFGWRLSRQNLRGFFPSLEGNVEGGPPEGWLCWGGVPFVAPHAVPCGSPTGQACTPLLRSSVTFLMSCAWVAELGCGRGVPGGAPSPCLPPGLWGRPPTSGLPLVPQACKAQKRMSDFKISQIKILQCLCKAMRLNYARSLGLHLPPYLDNIRDLCAS